MAALPDPAATLVPSQGSTILVPAQATASSGPIQGTASSASIQVSATLVPAQGNASSVPAQATAFLVPVQGAASSIPVQSTTTPAPLQGTTPSRPASPCRAPTRNRNSLTDALGHKLTSGVFLVCAVLTLIIVLYKDNYYSPKIDESDAALEWTLYGLWLAIFVWFVVGWYLTLRERLETWRPTPFMQTPPFDHPSDFIMRLLFYTVAGVVAHLAIVPTLNATTNFKTTLRESLLIFMPFVLTLAAIGSAMKTGIPVNDVERSMEMRNLTPDGQNTTGTTMPANNLP